MIAQKSSSSRYQSESTSNAQTVSAASQGQTTEEPRPPKTIDEYLVGQLEIDSGCTAEAVIPPPEACPDYVQAAGSLASMHFVTLIIVFGFIVILLEMSTLIFKDR